MLSKPKQKKSSVVEPFTCTLVTANTSCCSKWSRFRENGWNYIRQLVYLSNNKCPGFSLPLKNLSFKKITQNLDFFLLWIFFFYITNSEINVFEFFTLRRSFPLVLHIFNLTNVTFFPTTLLDSEVLIIPTVCPNPADLLKIMNNHLDTSRATRCS